MCVRMALSWPSERVARSRSALPRGIRPASRRAKGLERGLQVEEEESVVFSKHRGQGQARWAFGLGDLEVTEYFARIRSGPSGLGDLEVTEYIARIRSGPFEREDGAPVHLATTEARFMPD